MMFYDSYMMEELALALLPAVASGVPSFLFGIATYVLTSMTLYTMAKRRGIPGAWLGWVPMLNGWIWGSLSDQYRYVVKGQYKSKRKALLTLNILRLIIGIALTVLAVFMAVELADSFVYGMDEDFLLDMVMAPVVIAVVLALPLMGISIAALVIRYMALYDVYTSMDPGNNVLFLVLSIFFSVTEPFFLFFNRNKDEGMPPRKQAPAYIPPQPEWETPYETPQPEQQWQPYETPKPGDEAEKDYL